MTTLQSPIAVVGMACRFPGAPSLDAYWQLLRDGVDAITETPKERWSLSEFYSPDPSIPGKTNARWGGYIENIDQFDAGFFGISPREALAVSPQQRLLLEVTWHAVENAGIPMSSLSAKHGGPEKRTGVFVGVASFDYYDRAVQDPERMDGYSLTGNAYSVTANRLSYVFDLAGPSIAIDTACSSSLVAIHLACQSLLSGECSVALAGGAQVMLSPWINIAASKGEFLAPDGRCKTFDERANGYVRGEGIGMVVLKRLADAQRDGDQVWGIIHGSAVNQDGRSNGLTAPNPAAQVDVVTSALNRAGIAADQLGYIEAHGTGTKLGDPIELNALGKVLGQRAQPCFVGSVKSNFGHLEAAAGVAGFIKSVLCVKHGTIVPNLHFEKPNPLIDFSRLPMTVPTSLQAWPDQLPRYAGVSSFGFGGTNAHIVIGEAERPSSAAVAAPVAGPVLLCLSARSRPALARLVDSYRSWVPAQPEDSLHDVAATLAHGRDFFRERKAIVLDGTTAAAHAAAAPWRVEGSAGTVKRTPRVAFVFTGQGAQYPGMGRHLLAQSAVFRRTWQDADSILLDLLGLPLSALVYGSDASEAVLAQTCHTQLALYVLQVGLIRVLAESGIKPGMVLGHSVGEFAAAVAAGILSFEDGLRLVAKRASSMQACRADGAMLAVQLERKALLELLAQHGGEAVIAVVNGPGNIVVSGPLHDIAALEQVLAARGMAHRRLAVSHAFHSAAMVPAAQPVRQVAAALPHQPPAMPFVSSMSGLKLGTDIAWDEYWPEQMLAPVEFAHAAASLMEQQPDLVLELGPRPVLARLLASQANELRVACVLDPARVDNAALLAAMGMCFEAGIDLNAAAMYGAGTWSKSRLPGYAFESQVHQLYAPVTSGAARAQRFEHAWMRQARVEARTDGCFSISLPLGSARFPYLGDHTVFQADVLPATGFIELAQAAAWQVSGNRAWELEKLEFRRPLVLAEDDRKIRVDLTPVDRNSWHFVVTSGDPETANPAPDRLIFSCGLLRESRKYREETI